MERLAAIAREITVLTGVLCAPRPQNKVAGGSINECYRWSGAGGALFVKVAPRTALADLEAEVAGLAELAAARAVRVPRVLAVGYTDDAAFLALEWITAGARTPDCERRLGEGLAALHAVSAPRFGWARDNSVGRTPQQNAWSDDWAEFFRERRLRPQLARAVAGGYADLLEAPGQRLLDSVHLLLAGHRPSPSLLHGDLWGGNWLASEDIEPVVFDVAVYYGDREADLAMTRLFGGFSSAFYNAYESVTPPAAGEPLRRDLYNLYHVLNHANLFGAGYARQARESIDRLLAQLRG
ncbi:MAG: fructosamine kinase family protein [Steroidobacteraceae bacterium]